MPIIPSLSTISGEIAAAPHNNNYASIRTYVNDYAMFTDVARTVTALQTFTGGLTVSSGTTAVQALTCTTAVASSTIQGTVITASAAGGFIGEQLRPPAATSLTIDGRDGLLYFAVAGTARFLVNGSGHLLAQTDATYDIGASGANRPRNLFCSGTGTFGGTITGTLATAAQANITSVGTLTGLTVSGAVIFSNNSITLSGTAPEIYCGADAGGAVFNLSNNANTGNYIAISDPNGDSATSATMTLMGGFSLGTLHLGGAGLATNATKGFIEIPDMAGTPSGAAANYSVVWDSTNLRLMIRSGGAWKTIQAT